MSPLATNHVCRPCCAVLRAAISKTETQTVAIKSARFNLPTSPLALNNVRTSSGTTFSGEKTQPTEIKSGRFNLQMSPLALNNVCRPCHTVPSDAESWQETNSTGQGPPCAPARQCELPVHRPQAPTTTRNISRASTEMPLLTRGARATTMSVAAFGAPGSTAGRRVYDTRGINSGTSILFDISLTFIPFIIHLPAVASMQAPSSGMRAIRLSSSLLDPFLLRPRRPSWNEQYRSPLLRRQSATLRLQWPLPSLQRNS
jgi:hypothetical protein